MFVSGIDLVARIRHVVLSHCGSQSDPLALKIAREIEPDINVLIRAITEAGGVCAALADGEMISPSRAKRANAAVALAVPSIAKLTVEERPLV